MRHLRPKELCGLLNCFRRRYVLRWLISSDEHFIVMRPLESMQLQIALILTKWDSVLSVLVSKLREGILSCSAIMGYRPVNNILFTVVRPLEAGTYGQYF